MSEALVLMLDRFAARLGIDKVRSYGKSQGLLAPDILIDERNLEAGDDYILVQCCIDFCNWCLLEAALLVEEVNPAAWKSYFVDFYLAQVNNGGHGQFAGNSLMRANELDFISQGLTAMGADDFLEVFSEFRSAMEGDPSLRRNVIAGGGFGDIPPVIRDLDRRFFALSGTQRLIGKNSAWLRSSGALKPVALDDLRRRKALVLASSRLRPRRMAAAAFRGRRR